MPTERFTDGSKKPSEKEILRGIGKASSRWRELQAYIAEAYAVTPELVFYGKQHGWTFRYRKSGKALCSLFPEKGVFTILIVLGQPEVAAALAQRSRLSANVRRMLIEAKPLHDGRWLWIRPRSAGDLESIKTLLGIKRSPARAKQGEKGEAARRTPRNPATTDSPEVTAIKAFIDAINTQDLTALSALMTDDHTFVDADAMTVSGRETMVASWPQYFAMFPDYRIRVDLMLQNGTIVVALGSWSATYAGKRGPVSENALGGPAAWRALVEDARIKMWQVYADHTKTAEVMKRSEK